MMGRTHALSGVVAYLAAAAAVPTWHTSLGELVLGTAVAAGAAMLPDLDHPQSRIARAAGPVSWVVAVVVARLGGGHREVTHSLLGVALMALATWGIGTAGALPLGLWAAFLGALALGAVGPWRRFGIVYTLLCLLSAAALITVSAVDGPRVWVMVAAVAIGALTHVLGDMLTREGCPLLWPWRRRMALAALRTDGWVERLVVAPVLLIAALALLGLQGI